MMTGLLPAGHGVRENGRPLAGGHEVAAERLRGAGYRTAAFVSSFVLARRFGLARGFEHYDDAMPAGESERTARDTTGRALLYLDEVAAGPVFLWVHYFDPHYPYAPPEPHRTRFRDRAYLGEVAAMDEELGRLVQAFERRAGGGAGVLVVADHGEGLGEHGELQHGNLLYQATMHVPLLIVGPGVAPGVSDTPVSTRRVFHTLLDWAGQDPALSLRGDTTEVVVGEAMKPFLSYGWQPQTMAVDGRFKAIRAGRLEAYDLAADPGEERDLGEQAPLSRPLRNALREYPRPALDAPPPALDDEARRRLASLGYVGAGTPPVVREAAPRPVDMAHLFPVIEAASGHFVRGEHARAIPLFARVLAEDPHNLDAALRLGTAHSALGENTRAEAAFDKAAVLAPASRDVRLYRALHLAKGKEWPRAGPVLEEFVAESPDRLPALEALALIRERQGRLDEAITLRQRVYGLRDPSAAERVQLGRLAMERGRTDLALASFERARVEQGAAFAHDLELGVLYLDARRLGEARAALDRVPRDHSGHAMALFKRAQVSVLLREPDRAERIAAARRAADETTRDLIAREALFQR